MKLRSALSKHYQKCVQDFSNKQNIFQNWNWPDKISTQTYNFLNKHKLRKTTTKSFQFEPVAKATTKIVKRDQAFQFKKHFFLFL